MAGLRAADAIIAHGMITTVFFDLYGTLAGFEPSRYVVQSQACAEYGYEVTPEGVIKGYAAADAYMARENSLSPLRLKGPQEKEEFFAEYEKLVLQGSGVDVPTDIALKIWRKIRQVPYDLALFPDVTPTLEVLKAAGLMLGMISNMDRKGDELADSLGLAGHMDLAVTSSEVGVEKPHPDIFLAALQRADAKAVEAVHVGDQPTSDVDGALAVGIHPVLLDRDGNYKNFTRAPRMESLTELPGLLEGELDPSSAVGDGGA